MTHPLRSRALLTAVCAATVLVAGCQEDPQPLFDEDAGAWVLTLFKLEDSDEIDDFGSVMRVDKFMIAYDKAKKVVAAAACNDSMGNQGVKESLCDRTGPEGYACRCFNYEFNESQMQWVEFLPEGQPMPAEPDEEQQMMGALPFGSAYQIALEAYPGYSNTYRYDTLPFGVFDSNGYSSEHVFQLRDRSKFDTTGCAAVCGFTSAEMPMK
jgi:hypothetical protein